jgi:hypothetical protein
MLTTLCGCGPHAEHMLQFYKQLPQPTTDDIYIFVRKWVDHTKIGSTIATIATSAI